MMKKAELISLIILLFMCHNTYAQKEYQIIPKKSELTIDGNSTLHDWQMIANDFVCTASIDFDALKNKQIKYVHFQCDAEKILSDKNVMDKKAHKALKADEFPKVEFAFESIISFEQKEDQFVGEIMGVLALAGEKKEITIPFVGKILSESQFDISGTVPLKMSDFGISAPIFMFGAVKTGDDVNLKFQFTFKTIN
ncbi:MAG: YceI family protein [Bacteroidetes bacterium]|nr:YceI family protein [Bacteroidota bacterium]